MSEFIPESPAVFYLEDQFSRLNSNDLTRLREKLSANHQSVRVCAHENHESLLQTMMVIHPKNTYMPPRYDLYKEVCYQVIEGRGTMVFFQSDGEKSGMIRMGIPQSGRDFFIRVPAGKIHSIYVESEDLVLQQMTSGPYNPQQFEAAVWAPPKYDEAAVQTFMADLKDYCVGPATAEAIRPCCGLCHGDRLEPVLHLHGTPPSQRFLREAPVCWQFFPLDLYQCNSCGHFQIKTLVSLAQRTGDFVYKSHSTSGQIAHFKEFQEKCLHFMPEPQKILNLGCNDGHLLATFNAPTRIAIPAHNETGLRASHRFPDITFYREKLEDVDPIAFGKEHGKFDLIILGSAHALLTNHRDPKSLLTSCRNLLTPKGIIAFEAFHMSSMIKLRSFDNIYHEHLSYHTLTSLQPLLDELGLTCFDAEALSYKGGVFRGFLSFPKQYTQQASVEKLLQFEQNQTMEELKAHLDQTAQGIRSFLSFCQEHRMQLAAFGTADSSVTLAWYLGIIHQLDLIYDDNPEKTGLYFPGTNKQIKPGRELEQQLPPLTLILAWRFEQSILNKHQDYLDQGGIFLVPLPEPSLIHQSGTYRLDQFPRLIKTLNLGH